MTTITYFTYSICYATTGGNFNTVVFEAINLVIAKKLLLQNYKNVARIQSIRNNRVLLAESMYNLDYFNL